MTATTLCMARYVRKDIVAGAVDLYCHYPAGHHVHSWSTIKIEDDRLRQEAEERLKKSTISRRIIGEETSQERIEAEVENFCVDIEDGKFDQYLEFILSVAHDRKRTVRGARFFPRRK